MHEPKYALCVSAEDNVATLFADGVQAGSNVTVRDKAGRQSVIQASTAIPYAHKIAVKEIQCGQYVYKYGEVIGRATQDIRVGEHVHIHNVDSTRARGDLRGEEQ